MPCWCSCLISSEVKPPRHDALLLRRAGHAAVHESPIGRPDEREALARGDDHVLMEELRAACVVYVVEVGHENEVAARSGLHTVLALCVKGLIPAAGGIVLQVGGRGEAPRAHVVRSIVVPLAVGHGALLQGCHVARPLRAWVVWQKGDLQRLLCVRVNNRFAVAAYNARAVRRRVRLKALDQVIAYARILYHKSAHEQG
mmetsp:Transcript_43353/g.59250  ORF Transcript_43353/g.59250 Transcript_43353/m.59250 type:complete len:200 (-) Transcript_43353:188-787(-)